MPKTAKNAEQLEDEEPTDLATAPVGDKAKKSGKVAKKAAKRRESEPERDEASEDEAEQDEPTEEQLKKRKAALSKRRRKAKLVGYRSLSKTAGFFDKSLKAEDACADARDGLQSLLTLSDAKRLMSFTPATPGAVGFRKQEFADRLSISKQGVPASAARQTQARCDIILRAVVTKCVMAMIESGKKTITPSMVQSVLRPYTTALELTAVVPPIGLVRHGQDKGILQSPEWDLETRQSDKKEAAENKKVFMEHASQEEKRKQAARDKKAAARESQAKLLKAA